MNAFGKRQLLFLIIGATLCLCSCEKKQQKSSQVAQLPYYQEATFTPFWKDECELIYKDFHSIPSFTLINQNGDTLTEKSVEGKIYVADFFFTSCPGICPKMTRNMKVLQDTFLEDDDVLLLSHSVTPEYDSVSVLKAYAERNEIVDGKWHLLTGVRDHIYDLGRNYYFVEEDLGLEKKPKDFLHTENFVLVDTQRHIRGIYNGLNKTDVAQLIADIKTLKAESTTQSSPSN